MNNEPLTPEEYEQLLSLGGQNEEQAAQLALQQATAQRLRKGNQLQSRQAGNVTVAPHWTEMLGSIGREYKAGKADEQIAQGTSEQALRKQQQNAMLLRAITQGQQPQQSTAQGPGMGMPRPQGFQIPPGFDLMGQ